jgi:hypothetical protein
MASFRTAWLHSMTLPQGKKGGSERRLSDRSMESSRAVSSRPKSAQSLSSLQKPQEPGCAVLFCRAPAGGAVAL